MVKSLNNVNNFTDQVQILNFSREGTQSQATTT